ncbi:MAG: DUF305 domain-containing protein [Micrococcaceae bacterium]
MENKKQTLITASIGVLVVGAAFAIGPQLENHFGGTDESTTSHSVNQENSNSSESLVQKDSSEYKTYAALHGDAYDKSFIENMIIHHEGAVDMAKLALTKAQHQEIKDMANNIISTQTNEITQMQSWQKEWGYKSSSAESPNGHDSHANHGGSSEESSDMSGHMQSMMTDLQDKSGADFDQEFLSQMIVHHQGAIDMAAPGAQNAKHQQVKDLTKQIVQDQSKEIRQMQQWQQEW